MLTQASLAAVLLLASLVSADGDGLSRLAVIRAAPDFTLSDQDGKKVSRSDLKGKVWLVSFVFTTCTGSCPETTLRMSLVQRELKRRGLLDKGNVRMLSITLDPERDTAAVLRRYGKLYDAEGDVWSFLTGSPAEVSRVLADWHMWTRRVDNGQLDHPSRIFLVDRRGRIREVYNLAFLRPAWVAEDVELLLREKKEGS